jgi:hypothetical protein
MVNSVASYLPGIDILVESLARLWLMRPVRAPELARKARQKIPGIAVLFTTGYAENAALRLSCGSGG